MRRSLLLLPLLALLGCKTAPLNPSGSSMQSMMASTVQIMARITAKTLDGQEVHAGWSGSGVVYRIVDTGTKQPSSLVLTANHVLEAPEVGSVVLTDIGPVQIVDVEFEVINDRKTCNLEPLVLGESTTEDVATGMADCVIAPAADIGSSEPSQGDKVYVSGHPMGFPIVEVTEGYVGGYADGYLSISAAAWGGNSGGPVFFNGKVIGLLVRGSRQYPHISLVTPLQPILDRIKQTDAKLAR